LNVSLPIAVRVMLSDLLRILAIILIVALALSVGVSLALIGVPAVILFLIILAIGLLTRWLDPR
jgi:hypothetical protein